MNCRTALTRLTRLTLLSFMINGAAAQVPATVRQSSRDLPVAQEVDVAVVGGTTGGVAAAAAAAREGARVFLFTDRPYLGDDMTASYRLWLELGEAPSDPLARALYALPSKR